MRTFRPALVGSIARSRPLKGFKIAGANFGQLQLLGPLDFGLLVGGDVAAQGFGLPLDGLGGDLQTGQHRGSAKEASTGGAP